MVHNKEVVAVMMAACGGDGLGEKVKGRGKGKKFFFLLILEDNSNKVMANINSQHNLHGNF